MKIFLWLVAGVLGFLLMIGLIYKPSESEKAATYEENRRHCEKLGKVFVQRDVWSSGECMTMSEAGAVILKNQKELDNRGLR